MNTVHIDATPENIATMMQSGFIHSHQDGKWRYSPFDGETVYCNDPTALFESRTDFGDYSVAACPAHDLFMLKWQDGTRGVQVWNETYAKLCLLYGARSEGERLCREWLVERFSGKE